MLPSKWCRFLMRMMSPLKAGLIFGLLIAITSSHRSSDKAEYQQPSHSTQEPGYFIHTSNYSNHQSSSHPSSSVELKKHVHLPFAKDFLRKRTNSSGLQRRYYDDSPNDSSRRNAEDHERTPLPNLKLRSKLRVSNGTGVNSTIVYLPRLSRAMGNFSNPAVHRDLQPIIVSSRRRLLIDPKHFTVKRKPLLAENSSLVTNSPKKREIPTSSTLDERRNSRLKFRDISLSSKNNRTRQYPNASIQRVRLTPEKDFLANKQLPKSKVFVKTVSEKENGAIVKKKSTVRQVPPTTQPKSVRLKNSSKGRRQGRQFKLEIESLSNEQEQTSQTQPESNKSPDPDIPNQTEKYTNLFKYTYSTGVQRDLKPFKETKFSTVEYENDSAPSSPENLSFADYGMSYTAKKAQNLTIYEILKPKLKTDRVTLNSSASAEDSIERDLENVSKREESSIESLDINEIKKEMVRNSMVILPGRSDASYGVENVVVNRNDSAVILHLKPHDNASNDSHESSEQNNSSLTQNPPKQEPKPQLSLRVVSSQEISETQIPLPKDLLRIKTDRNTTGRSKTSANSPTAASNSSKEIIQYDAPKAAVQLDESESIREAKMAANRVPIKDLKLDSKMFYDYFAKKPIGANVTLRDFPYPEFRPGNMFRYSDIYNRKPILDFAISRPPPFVNDERRRGVVTAGPLLTPTTFNSLRTSLRVVSTYYPNRMQDVTMKFGNRVESTTVPFSEELPEFQQDDEFDEYRDAVEPGFTMEKLAYLLIGTCCGLSILCLFVVVIAIKCRRSMVEKRIKAQFKKRMYYHEKMKDMSTPWQQQMFDHFMYLHRRPGGESSCSRSTESCNCRCVTWSLGARNLDASRPLFPTRSGSYLCGQKKLPFGAASTLRYESMLGRKRTSPDLSRQQKSRSPHTDSSHENDSLDIDSDSREGDGPKKCTCIEYNIWPMPPPNVPRGFFTMCPNVNRYNAGSCSQHPPVELRTLSKDVPPPVTGSNYLDRSEGVVYWSSNDERLI